MAIPYHSYFWNATLLIILVEWLRRAVWLNHLKKIQPPLERVPFSKANAPKVSIIVPAKNEENNIVSCIEYLSRQNYPDFEMLVIDDRSSDRTPDILENLKKKFSNLRTIRVEKLPTGWTGKNHAMFVGSKAAQGTWILFTDADTTHSPESLSTSMECAVNQQIDFLTLSPETESKSFWEKTVQPLAASSLALWFDPQKVNDSKCPAALANGQFILIKKDIYEKVGGNEAVKLEVVEDVALARKTRAKGFCVRFLNGSKLYSTRMYSSLQEIITGWTRILKYLFNNSIPELLHKIFLFVFFSILPFIIFLVELAVQLTDGSTAYSDVFCLSATVCALIIILRMIGNKLVKTNPLYAIFHPLGSLVMTWILCICIYRILFNRASLWRGDSYK